MGLRTAAAKLGFRLAAATTKKHNRISLSQRRFTSLASPDTNINVDKSSSYIYLCFDERKVYGAKKTVTKIVVRPIRLDTYEDEHNIAYLLTEEACSSAIFDFTIWNRSIRLGSQILFAVGSKSPRHICWVNPLTRPLKYHISSPTETKIKSFSTPISNYKWEVIDRKLYCFQDCFDSYSKYYCIPPCGLPFEVFDTEIEDAKWQPLSRPPFIHEYNDRYGYDSSDFKPKYDYNVLFLNESKKILGWECEKSGLFSFDTTKPENGWMEFPPSSADSLSFIARDSTRLVIGEHHPRLGKFNLAFSYDCLDEPFLVSTYFISDNCDSCQAIEQVIHFPKDLHSRYRVSIRSSDSEFVHLGGNKFCLVLHEFFLKDSCDRNRTKGNILIITFEYDIIVSDDITKDAKPNIEIKTRLLGTRPFTYLLKKNRATCSILNGAFVF